MPSSNAYKNTIKTCNRQWAEY